MDLLALLAFVLAVQRTLAHVTLCVVWSEETHRSASTHGLLADNGRTSLSLKVAHQESADPAALCWAECRWEPWLTLMSGQGFIVCLEIRNRLPLLALAAKQLDPSSLSFLLVIVVGVFCFVCCLVWGFFGVCCRCVCLVGFGSGGCCYFKWFLSPKAFSSLGLFFFYSIFIANCLSCLSFGPQSSGGPLRASHILRPTVLFLFSACPPPQSWNKSK